MKVLHILNSDFGARATMGIRSYYIAKEIREYTIFCRANLSEMHEKIFHPLIGYRILSRGIQYLRMVHNYFSKLRKLERFFFENSCKKHIKNSDIVHLFYPSRQLLDYATRLKKKIIVEGFTNPLTIQEMYNNGVKLDNNHFELNQDELYCYQNCDLLISPSQWVTHSMKELPMKGKIVEIPYGVEKYEVKEKDISGKIKFCFAGGLKRTKGIIDLLEAVQELNVDYNNQFEVHIYGRLYSEIKNEIDGLKGNNIFFHGYIDDVYKIYQDKHVYVFPTYFEGSSKTVFEAMAFGLPVITTFNSGSLVKDEVNGFIINMNSASEIFLSMQKFIENKNLILAMGSESLKIARSHTWNDYGKNVATIYESMQ